MSQCCTCKNYSTCSEKDIECVRRLEAFCKDMKCSDYEYQKPLTPEELRDLFRKGQI